MARSKRKMWRNGPGGRWTARIQWYDSGSNAKPSTADIRLQLEDCDMKINYYPESIEEADHVWFMFKNQAAPPDGQRTPCIVELLRLLCRKYPQARRIFEQFGA